MTNGKHLLENGVRDPTMESDEPAPPKDDGWNITCRCEHSAPIDDFVPTIARLKGWYRCPSCGLIFQPGKDCVVVMQEDGPLWDQVRLDRLKKRLEQEEQERIQYYETMKKEDRKRWLRTRRILKEHGIAI